MAHPSDASWADSAQSTQPDLIAALRRQWVVIVLCALLGALGGWYFAAAQETTYEAKATLLLIATESEQSPGGGLNRTLDIDTWATVARSTDLLQAVADELGLSLEAVRSRSTAAAAATGDVLLITFSGKDSDVAAQGAAVYSERFLEARQTSANAETISFAENLREQQDAIELQIDELSQRIAEEEAKGDLASTSQLAVLTETQRLAIARLATVNTTLDAIDTNVETGRVVINPQTAVTETGFGSSITTLAGAFLGLLLGLIVALFRDRFDHRYGSSDGAEAFGVSEIGRVPYSGVGRGIENGYSRVVSRLNIAGPGEAGLGTSVLVLPVESTTLPPNVAQVVTDRLKAAGQSTGLVVGTLADSIAHSPTQAYWDATVQGIRGLTDVSDVVLVPTNSLEDSAVGIGLSALVDTILILVSDRTPTTALQQAIDDVAGADASRLRVLMLSGIRRRDRRATADASARPLAQAVQ
jgi:capsular polysaccharide biosynthesis protein